MFCSVVVAVLLAVAVVVPVLLVSLDGVAPLFVTALILAIVIAQAIRAGARLNAAAPTVAALRNSLRVGCTASSIQRLRGGRQT